MVILGDRVNRETKRDLKEVMGIKLSKITNPRTQQAGCTVEGIKDPIGHQLISLGSSVLKVSTSSKDKIFFANKSCRVVW